MEYETVNHEAKMQQLNQAIAGQESQHYALVLDKIANGSNKAAVENIDAQLRIREKAIVALRAERDKEKANAAADEAEPTTTDEPEPAHTPEGIPAVPELPPPGASLPESDTPKP